MKAVTELVETERNYVARLKLLIEAFVEPLQSAEHSRKMSSGDHSALFSNVITIYGFNSKFLEGTNVTHETHTRTRLTNFLFWSLFSDLDHRFDGWDDNTSLLGDKFVEFTPYFAMYQT